MTSRKWQVIGAPIDFGSQHSGTAKGPAAIRKAGLTRRIEYLVTQGFEVTDGGDVPFDQTTESDPACRGLTEMLWYAPRLMDRLDEVFQNGAIPIVLGGDHSIPIASISAAANVLRASQGPDATLGLIWVDAHPDLETPGSENPNDLHAMSAAHLLGAGVSQLQSLCGFTPKVEFENLVYIGLRTNEPVELQFIHDHNLTIYTASDIERVGFVNVCEKVFRQMRDTTDALAVSFDLDAIDPLAAPGVDYPHAGGLTVRESFVFMEFVYHADSLMLLEVVELNPEKDSNDATAQLAGRLIHRAIEGPFV